MVKPILPMPAPPWRIDSLRLIAGVMEFARLNVSELFAMEPAKSAVYIETLAKKSEHLRPFTIIQVTQMLEDPALAEHYENETSANFVAGFRLAFEKLKGEIR